MRMRSLSLQTRIISLVILIVGIVLALSTYLDVKLSEKTLEEGLKERAVSLAQELAATIGTRGELEDPEVLKREMEEIKRVRKAIDAIGVFAFTSRGPALIASTGGAVKKGAGQVEWATVREGRLTASLEKMRGQRQWNVAAPIRLGGEIIGAIVVFLAVVLFAVRNNVAADDLKVGDCFNIPNGTSIQTVEKHPCNENHNGEVFFVGEYTEGSNYPISLTLDRYIESACVPAFEAYLGRSIDSEPALSVSYFYPSMDGWDDGDRTITCYVSQPDKSPMTESLKG